MPKLPGVNHLRAVGALEKAGFRIDRQGKHIFMSNGAHRVRSTGLAEDLPENPWFRGVTAIPLAFGHCGF